MARLADTVAGTPIQSSWHNTNRDRTITPFTNAAERTSQWPTPAAGALSFLNDTLTVWVYNGSAWEAISGGPQPRYSVRAYRSAAFSMPAAPNTTIIPFDTEVYDYGNNYVTGTSATYTVPVTGLYIVACALSYNVNNSPDWATLKIYVNGVEHTQLDRGLSAFAGTVQWTMSGSATLTATVGQTIDVRMQHATGGNAQSIEVGSSVTWVTIDKV